MPNKIKLFIEKIRNSDEAVKKRWVIALSAAVMTLVVFVWLSYMSILVGPVQEASSDTAKPQSEFWAVMKNGLGILTNLTKDKIKYFISKIESDRLITIEK